VSAFTSGSSYLGVSPGGFNPSNFDSSTFDLNKTFTGKFDIPSFSTGVNLGGGFGGTKSNGGFLSGLAGRLGGLFGGGQGDNAFGQALGLGTFAGNLGIQAANAQNMAAEVAAQNAQTNLLTDFDLQRIAKGDQQTFDTNRKARQLNLMAQVPVMMNNVTYTTKNPNVGAAMGAQLAGMIG